MGNALPQRVLHSENKIVGMLADPAHGTVTIERIQMPVIETIETAHVPVKIWTSEVDDAARQQLRNVAELPFVFHHVAAMPDVHVGKGATIGSVIATKGAVIPAAVGVDIGCGMAAVRLNLTPDRLDEASLRRAFDAILACTPVGTRQHTIENTHREACAEFEAEMADIETRTPGILRPMKGMNWRRQLGTLGGGNHFIELEVDEADGVWLMLHSGSRGVGNVMAQHFIRLAMRHTSKKGVVLPDRSLSYFEEGEELFNRYMQAVHWAQRYARVNRQLMAADILRTLATVWPGVEPAGDVIDCHHNYVEKETHFGESVYVTRKGAIRAGAGELGIVPGSMGDASYIVEGLGNPESFMSSAHGAGRRYGREECKRRFTVDELERLTEGIVCRKDAGVLDEIPCAYKPIDAVMENEKDLVRIVHHFRQVLCVKG